MPSYLRLALNSLAIALLLLWTTAMFVPLFMRYLEAPHMYLSVDGVPKTDAALVLGASVSHGRPSPILEERAATAVQLYLSGRVSKILVTGDNGALSHDEVTPVRKYLLGAGIPAKDIFLDHAGFDTYSSMYRARTIFQARSVTVVTQDFHLPRALFIARELGLDASGIDAGATGGTGWDYIREVPASIKAIFDLALHRKPKYLGDPIPLSGDGSKSWY